MRTKLTVLFTLVAAALGAQIAAPTLGLIYDAPNQALRRISGMPGAAIFGEPILEGIASAFVAPDHSYAIVNDGEYKIYTSAGLRALPAGLPNSAHVAFSPTSETAAFYADESFTLVTGLPSQPVLRSFASPGAVKRFAVNSRGLILMSIAQGDRQGIFALSPDTQAIQLLDVASAGAIVFANDGNHAWIADTSGNCIWSLANLDSSPVAEPIAIAPETLDSPSALALSPDGGQLFIANRGTATVVSFDLKQNAVLSSTPCSCDPTTLTPLASASVFALTDLATGPMWIFDSTQSTRQTMFIPAVQR